MLWHAVSLGGALDVWTPRTGAVHSVFAGAINLRVDDELWTVLGAGKPDQPFGIRLAPGVTHRVDVPAAAPVRVRAGFVGVGPLVLDCRAAARWTPAPWPSPADGLADRLRHVERAAQARAWSGSPAMAAALAEALADRGPRALCRLVDTVRRSVGRGPGLTPSGDDVLVGLLTGLGGAGAQPALDRLGDVLAPLLRGTTELSRHLLVQARRGQPGRALHELGRALCEGPPGADLARSLAPVLDTGATSGADACLGLGAACRLLFLAPERLAA